MNGTGEEWIAKELVKYDGYAVMCYDRDGNRMSYVEAAAKRLLAEKKEER